MSKLNTQHASLAEVHKAVLAKYRDVTGEPDPLVEYTDDVNHSEAGGASRRATLAEVSATAEQVAARCETVLNVTMSEMDRIHRERVQDWNSQATHLLDAQIDFYREVLTTLEHARSQFGPEEQHGVGSSDGPILPSPYESQLGAPIRALPLLQPEQQAGSSYFAIWK